MTEKTICYGKDSTRDGIDIVVLVKTNVSRSTFLSGCVFVFAIESTDYVDEEIYGNNANYS